MTSNVAGKLSDRTLRPPGGMSSFSLFLLLLSLFASALPEVTLARLPLSVVLLGLAVLVQSVFGIHTMRLSKKFVFVLLLYLVTLLVPAFYADNTGYLFSYYYLTIAAVIACMLMQTLLQHKSPAVVRRWVLLAIVATGSVLSGRVLYDLQSKASTLSWILQTRNVSVGAMASNHLAAVLAMSLVCTVGLTYDGRRRGLLVRLVGVAIGGAQLLALLATGSRGGMVAFVVGVLALAWLTKSRALVLGLTLIVAFGVAATLLLVPEVVQAFLSRISRGDLSGRSELWVAALQVVSDHPLFGVGMGNFVYSFEGQESLWMAHNIVLQQLLNGGIFALGAYVWLWTIVVSAVRTSVRLVRQATERIHLLTLVSALITVWVHSLAEPALGTPNVDLLVWAIVGVCVVSGHVEPVEHVQPLTLSAS